MISLILSCLEKDDTISSTQKSELESLRAELARINNKKEEYVTEHPEHRRLVYRSNYKKTSEPEEKQVLVTNRQRNVFDKNGLPRHPERSIYYDPVMNPYGVPPPGMLYMERRKLILASSFSLYLDPLLSFATRRN